LKLYLVSFGKLKTPGLREAADYYLKLIQPRVAFEEVELKPLHVGDKSAANRKQIQTEEGEILSQKLAKLLTARGAFYLLDEGGKTRNTQDWAKLVREWEGESVSEVALCVGSSLGFSDALRKRARGILSLGSQTLPHELARVVLCEQIYRAWSVTRGHPYHNEGS
jgi:23S rRNA (pseudouridine1915-N3)-methyltransferase